jgi:hypothetical protein
MKHPAYPLMVQASKGRITSFRTDLTKHDKAALSANDPKRPFVWCMHSGGTHLCFVDQSNLNESSRRETPPHAYPAMIEEAFGGCSFIVGGLNWYAWDGLALIPLASTQAATEWARAQRFCIECDSPLDKTRETRRCPRCFPTEGRSEARTA